MPFSFKPPQQEPEQVFTAAAIGDKIKKNKGQVFTFLCFLILGVMVFISIVLFTYQKTLAVQVENLKEELTAKDAEIGSFPVEKMTKTSKRIKAVKSLVSRQTSANTALRIAEETIENSSLYKTVEVKVNPFSGTYDLSLNGQTNSYKSVVQQSEAFKNKMYGKYIKSSQLEGVGPSDDGSISFSYKLVIDIKGVFPELIIFDQVNTVSSSTP